MAPNIIFILYLTLALTFGFVAFDLSKTIDTWNRLRHEHNMPIPSNTLFVLFIIFVVIPVCFGLALIFSWLSYTQYMTYFA